MPAFEPHLGRVHLSGENREHAAWTLNSRALKAPPTQNKNDAAITIYCKARAAGGILVPQFTSPTACIDMTSSGPSSSSPNTRLSQIKDHTMGSAGPYNAETLFNEKVVPQAPTDPMFGLMAAYKKDTDSKKVDLGIGAYRDNDAKPWRLPVVKKVRLSEQ